VIVEVDGPLDQAKPEQAATEGLVGAGLGHGSGDVMQVAYRMLHGALLGARGD
jgi:hypothetical protein